MQVLWKGGKVMNIVLYKSTTCPQCKVVKMKMEKKGIPFIEEMDINVMKARGVGHVPTLEVDGERMIDIGTINRWINAQEAQNG